MNGGQAQFEGVDVFVRPDWPGDALEFFVRRRVLNGWEILRSAPREGRFTAAALWEGYDAGEIELEPSFRIERSVWTAMLRASEGMIEPSAASERHLTDAIALRDRVFGLLEDQLRREDRT